MDKLETIFEMQKELNDQIIQKHGLQSITSEEWIQKHLLALIAELGELLEEINYRWWKNKKPVNPDAVHEELTDILHFYISMCLSAGMDATALFDCYIQKNLENHKRQDGLSEKEGYKAND